MNVVASNVSSLVDRTDCHIIALTNVGWGNTVYVRGEGAGLHWDSGTPLCCTGDNLWVFTHPAIDPPSAFKFLRNDTTWALGENHVASGQEISLHVTEFPPS